MKRQIMIDTETTGLYHDKTDRLIEVGCIELIDRVRTGRTFRTLINPEREIPQILIDTVHGITNEMVKDAPKFAEIADDFVKFIDGAELIAHNAVFDVGFINMELKNVGKKRVNEYVPNVICTLELDRLLFPQEKKHKLDVICDRFGIDRSHRDLHGALIDCDLTIDVFLEYYKRFPEKEIEALVNIKQTIEQTAWERPAIKRFDNILLPSVTLSDEDNVAHVNLLQELEKKEKIQPIFNKSQSSKHTM